MKPLFDVDLEQLKKQKEQNFKERLEFIDFYAAWVRRTPNNEWSRQQKELIG